MGSVSKTVAGMSQEEFTSRLWGEGLGLQFGPFAMHLVVQVPGLASTLYPLYRDYAVLEGPRLYSCHFTMSPVQRYRWPPKRMVRAMVDGRSAQEDMPIEH